MTDGFEIRTLGFVHLAARIEEFVAIAADVPNEYWRREHFLAELPQKWVLSCAAWTGPRPIAYAIISRRPAGNAHLHHFMVAADWRGRGLGSRLLEAGFGNCRQAGCQSLTLKVAMDNRAGQRFYKLRGFEDAEKEGRYLLMRRTLGI